ncbi:MAG: HDIG domain-containing protein [Methanomicrobiales archaeon]|nr:HDIG domain-containing protein [Methanomicrobiales archaeon]
MSDPPEDLLRREGCSERVIAHCRAVCTLALTFSGSGIVDRELVRQGAMFHDIGRCRSHTVAHAQEGAAILREMGIPEDVVRVAERHIGAGLTADECSLLGLLPRDCMPQTLEEQIVANADNLVQGQREGSIVRLLQQGYHLKQRLRYRHYRLWIRMEAFR